MFKWRLNYHNRLGGSSHHSGSFGSSSNIPDSMDSVSSSVSRSMWLPTSGSPYGSPLRLEAPINCSKSQIVLQMVSGVSEWSKSLFTDTSLFAEEVEVLAIGAWLGSCCCCRHWSIMSWCAAGIMRSIKLKTSSLSGKSRWSYGGTSCWIDSILNIIYSY